MKKFLALLACIILSGIFSVIALAAPAMSQSTSHGTTQTDNEQPAKAVVKSKPQPHYPKEARKRKIAATIVLRAIFRASGEVTDIKFQKVIPGDLPEDVVEAFTKECFKAARKIKFEPAMKDGHPASMYIQLEYDFRPD